MVKDFPVNRPSIFCLQAAVKLWAGVAASASTSLIDNSESCWVGCLKINNTVEVSVGELAFGDFRARAALF